MERTLFTPAMIETFRACRKLVTPFRKNHDQPNKAKGSTVLKGFLLKAIAEINRGRVTNLAQVQKFLGQHWPADDLPADESAQAFLFAYKVLNTYMAKPYCPKGAQIVGINLKVRARQAEARAYLEDTFDLILWYPKERRLEFVDYHLHSLKPFDQSWPSAFILVKQFLAERLKTRWPFEKLTLTFYKVGINDAEVKSINLDESLYRLHWPDLVKTVEDMKDPNHHPDVCNPGCERCQFLAKNLLANSPNRLPLDQIYRTA
jgi:hypothetical protein